MSLLLSLQSDTIRFLWSVDMFAILCRICSIDFFCISFISLLFIILIMTSRFLQSDDELFLKRCSLVAISSLVTFAHDVIFVERRVFFCVCNCLLSSWTDWCLQFLYILRNECILIRVMFFFWVELKTSNQLQCYLFSRMIFALLFL